MGTLARSSAETPAQTGRRIRYSVTKESGETPWSRHTVRGDMLRLVSAVDSALIETLLFMSESDVLDFKRDQYPLADATDEQKSALVKDVVAFANAWKMTDAYIVVGADENPGGRATVTGVDVQLDDADLQQLVNSKTNTPVTFGYLPVTIDGKPAALIRIAKDQSRPIFLKKAFGKLKPNTVYLRRGSSTAEAAPDEIARMGAASVAAASVPSLDIQLADPEERAALGQSVVLTSRILTEQPSPPPRSEMPPDLISKYLNKDLAWLNTFAAPPVRAIPSFRGSSPDPKKVMAYKRELAMLQRIGFRVCNTGQVTVQGVRVVLAIPKASGLFVVDDLPEPPRSALDMVVSVRRLGRAPRAIVTNVQFVGAAWEVEARLDKLQPSAVLWSEPFWVGSKEPRDLDLVAQVYGDNIPKAIDVPVQIKVEVVDGYLDDETEDEP